MKIGKLTSIRSVCLIAAMSAAASADTIRLKNGTLIKGKVTGYSNGSFSVVIVIVTSAVAVRPSVCTASVVHVVRAAV